MIPSDSIALINADRFFTAAFYLMLTMIMLPLSMTIPGMVRNAIQVVTVILFIIGLLMLSSGFYLIAFIFLSMISVLYCYGSWAEVMAPLTFIFNSLCCWMTLIYAVICIRHDATPNANLFYFALALSTITALTTIVGLGQYPLAVRELGRGESYAGEDIRYVYRTLNIASWSQLYGMVFLQGCLAHRFRQTRHIGLIILIVILEICIIKSQLTFALLFSIVIVLAVLIIPHVKVSPASAGFLAVLSVGLLLAFEPLLQVAISASDSFGFDMLSTKLHDLYNLAVSHEVTGDAIARLDLYTLSLEGLKGYPLGLFLMPDVVVEGRYIGFHSELFDFIGTMGILGILLMIVFVIFAVRAIREVSVLNHRKYLFVTLVAFMVFFSINPVFYSPQLWVSAFLLPAIVICLDGQSEELGISEQSRIAMN